VRCSILRPALLLACLGMAAPGSAQLSPGTGRPGERAMPIEAARAAILACGNPALAAMTELPADTVGVLAYGLLNPGWAPAQCTKRDPRAALALLQAYAGDPLRRDAGSLALSRLSEMYGEPSDARTRRRRDDIRRLLWLRGQLDPAPDDALLTRAEQERILSDPANVAFLRRWVALLPSDPAPRRRLTAALLVEGSPGYDPVAAVAAIPDDALLNLRLRLLRALLAEERTFGAALDQLPRLYIQPWTLAAEDVVLIEAIVGRASRLFEQRGEPSRTTGARVLAAIAEAGMWQAQTALQSALARAGCCMVMSEFPSEARVRPLLVTDEDYPAAAIRGSVAGVVRLEAYFGPDGRLVYVDGGWGEPSVLRRAAVGLWRRRSLRDVELQAHRGHYVRIAGPTVEFRLPRCIDGVAQPLPPPDPARITLTAICMRQRSY
jgi:hypothetical protein